MSSIICARNKNNITTEKKQLFIPFSHFLPLSFSYTRPVYIHMQGNSDSGKIIVVRLARVWLDSVKTAEFGISKLTMAILVIPL